jgi:propanol-preferring alcohol dehydrogenase
MKAMVIERICNLKEEREPLRLADMPTPVPGNNEILVNVSACGICHTELDEIEGRTSPPRFPVIPGHQIVGTVIKTGKYANTYKPGDRIGVAWIHSACGTCRFCQQDNENLCDCFEATGRDAHGGYAEFTTVSEKYAYPIPNVFRSLRLTAMRDGENVGLVGFGASAHLVIQMIRHKYPSSKIFVFARNEKERAFAKKLGAYWAGNTTEKSPEKLHRAIDTTPVWGTVINALTNLEKGGRLIINAIRKEDTDKQAFLEMDYPSQLWLEKEIKSVANVTGRDVREFLALAAAIPIKPEIQTYKLEEANKALIELKEGNIQGAKVLVIA